MTTGEYLGHMSEILDTPPEQLRLNAKLEELEGWSSIAILGFMAFADEHAGAQVSNQDLRKCATLEDLATLIGLPIEQRPS